MQGVSLVAARKGALEAGVKDNEIIVFSELMDAKSLFLTANADTVYFVGFIDVSKGPVVFEVPPKALGTLDDMWFREGAIGRPRHGQKVPETVLSSRNKVGSASYSSIVQLQSNCFDDRSPTRDL